MFSLFTTPTPHDWGYTAIVHPSARDRAPFRVDLTLSDIADRRAALTAALERVIGQHPQATVKIVSLWPA